jgi:NTE family protein
MAPLRRASTIASRAAIAAAGDDAMFEATKPRANLGSRSTRGELCVLVLQGGGALGAYEAGVYERLAATKLEPDWVVGISIGAVNGALIAGNPPQRRAERLREFWERVSVPGWGWLPGQDWSSHYAMAFGVPGFFSPRLTPAALAAPGSDAALSYYDPAPLRATLEELVDFDRLNHGGVRLSVGAVEVVTGDGRWFDTAHERITVDHILASGALPPGFPPVVIEGVAYWDGGIVSNTPLQYVIDHPPARDLLVFQVDLFSARGRMPRTLADVTHREKDIRYSSRTSLQFPVAARLRHLRQHAAQLIAELPPEQRRSPAAQALIDEVQARRATLVRLVRRGAEQGAAATDVGFGHAMLSGLWQEGRADMDRLLASDAWRRRSPPAEGLQVIEMEADNEAPR